MNDRGGTRRPRGALVAIVVVLVVAALGGLGWWRSADRSARAQAANQKEAPPLEFQPTEVVRPERRALRVPIEMSGPLVAPSSAIVRAKVGARLLRLAVAEGERVRAGQELGVLDMADGASRVAERAALVQAAQASLAQAQRTHAQNERLAAQQFISAAALDGSAAAVQTARAQRDAAQAAWEASRAVLRDGALRAPIGGIVARRQAVAGEMLAAEQPVITIVDLARLELAAAVPSHEVSRLQPGMAVQVSVEGHDAPVAGRIARIAPAAEAGTRAIGVTVELPNPGERLRAGQYAVARVALADAPPRLSLPLTAISASGGQHHVWVLAEGKLARRAVTLGRRDEQQARVEILDGADERSVVLAARFENLREGAAATVAAAASAPVSR